MIPESLTFGASNLPSIRFALHCTEEQKWHNQREIKMTLTKGRGRNKGRNSPVER
jgi:hypothetical protein